MLKKKDFTNINAEIEGLTEYEISPFIFAINSSPFCV
jgi:hypothetical protein